MRSQRTLAVAGLAALSLVVAGCAPQDEATATPSASASTAACTPASLATKTPGTLTIGTDKPAYPPYFVDDDPTNGKGLESSIAYAVATQLGYDTAKVTWVTASFNSAAQPGPKPFDFDINQFSITDERKKAVDFSSGYYDVAQSVVTIKGTRAASATSIAGLKDVKFGAAVGTTSYSTITDVIKPTPKPAVFDDNDKAKLALINGQIDALVVDLPTGIYQTSVELDNGVLVGQVAPPAGEVEQFGLVLEKGSSLTSCVTQAVDALRTDGTLKKLETEWLTVGAKAPVLT